jgi:hypothetical protein
MASRWFPDFIRSRALGGSPAAPWINVYSTSSPTKKQTSPSTVQLAPIRTANLEEQPSVVTMAKVVGIAPTSTTVKALIVPFLIVGATGSFISALPAPVHAASA